MIKSVTLTLTGTEIICIEQAHRENDRNQRKGAPPKVIIDLSRLAEQEVMVRLSGGRQVRGILKGWDPLLNLVLDDVVEELRGMSCPMFVSMMTEQLLNSLLHFLLLCRVPQLISRI